MSSIVNKIKDAVSSDKHHSDPEGTHGSHNSRAANATDPRIDSDADNRQNAGYSGTTGTGVGTGAGTHSTGTHTTGTHTTGGAEGHHGPHSSRAANAADPRIDSDRDHRAQRTVGGENYGAGTGLGGAGTTGYGTSNTTSGAGYREGEHGSHNSRVANAADPRIDSDRDHRAQRTVGGENYGAGAGLGGAGTTGYGTGSSGTGGYGAGSTGTGYGAEPTSTGFGSTGYGSNATDPTGYREGERGPHNSRAANAADPRIDSDRDNRARHVGGENYNTSGPGPARNTAGPHKSDMMNKADPRVDSNLDGSKTLGGNKTYDDGYGGAGGLHKDPTDPSQVPPSVLQRHVGGPSIEHDDHTHDRERRHSITTHQETHRGI